MLTIDLEVIRNIVELVHEISSLEVSPGETISEEWNEESQDNIYEMDTEDPIQQQVRGLIDGLNEDEAYDIVALMWIGRGTYGIDEFQEARKVAREEATQSTADYLLGTPLLADYLEEGLDIVENYRRANDYDD
jgi:hypothetical protein